MDLNDEGERRDWITSFAGRGDLPIFKLIFPAIEGRYADPRRIGAPVQYTSRRPDSGIFELWRPQHLRTSEALAPLSQELIEMAGVEDPRSWILTPETESEVIAAEWESHLLPPQNLPVIGPGGRIMIAREASGTTAEIVVRKRGGAITSHWRSTDDLMASLTRRITQCSSRTASVVQRAFGYFELSKYESQAWLRPAFMVLVELTIPGDERIRWIETIVEPATETKELSLADGLGSWSE
jgi:hypothetical protein